MTEQPERWTQATVYPDMWIDPSDDPRASDGVSPDGELPTLLDYTRAYRLTIRMKCDGLSPEQLATRSVPPSTMSLLGLVRHLAETERDWRGWLHVGDPEPRVFGPKGSDFDFDPASVDQSLVDAAFTALEHQQRLTDAALAEHQDLGERVGEDAIAIREILVHRIEEYARHAGHADLLRECVDGRVGQ